MATVVTGLHLFALVYNWFTLVYIFGHIWFTFCKPVLAAGLHFGDDWFTGLQISQALLEMEPNGRFARP